MHCHTEFHNTEGMALYVKVGDHSDMNKPPSGMNTCGNMNISAAQFEDRLNNPVSSLDAGQLHLSFRTC